MSAFSDRLETALAMRSMSPADLSRATKISEGAISQYRSGKCKAAQKNLEKIASALNVSIPWLMGVSNSASASPSLSSNIIPLPTMRKVPRLGAIACGQPILAVESTDEYDEVPESVTCDFTLLCKGDSMINARIFDGDVVYIRQQPEVENGQIAAVRIGDEATLKKVYYTPGSDRITLRACNPLYPDIVYEGDSLRQIQILGLAVGFFSLIRHE